MDTPDNGRPSIAIPTPSPVIIATTTSTSGDTASSNNNTQHQHQPQVQEKKHDYGADRRRMYVAVSCRAISVGMTGPVLGVHMANSAYGGGFLGLLVGIGMLGATIASAGVTWRGDSWGRRKVATLCCLMTGMGTIIVALGGPEWFLLLTAFVCMLNGMGKDRGTVTIVETAMLPNTVTDEQRTTVFSRYTICQDLGQGFGSLASGLVDVLMILSPTMTNDTASGWTLALAGLASVIAAPMYGTLSQHMELAPAVAAQPVSAKGRRTIAVLSGLFSLDAIGGGFISTAGISYMFAAYFDASPAVIGALFVVARVLNAASNFMAPILAKRIGLVNTMVFTHIPSNIFVMLICVAPNIYVAAALFLARECLVEMDVPTRQSYMMAVVEPHERTATAGFTAIVRTGGWSLGSFLASPMTAQLSAVAPLIAGGAIKTFYDLSLWVALRHTKPPEEMKKAGTAIQQRVLLQAMDATDGGESGQSAHTSSDWAATELTVVHKNK